MTKRQAYAEWLQFHGCAERSYANERAKKTAADLRKAGYRAVLVNDDGFSEVYVEKQYFVDQTIATLQKRVDSKDARIANAYEKYLQEVAKIEAETAQDETKLQELKGVKNV